MDYAAAGKSSWLEVEKDAVFTGVRPYSVHFPLNLPGQDHFIYCDCAFNVYRLDVPPDMRMKDVVCDRVRADLRLPLVSFAFDTPAFVPDFRQSRWERIGGGYPMAHGTFHAFMMQYDLEYALDPETSLTHIRCTVTNHDETPRTGVIRCLQSCPFERAVMEYHYRPFRWDAGHWAELAPDDRQPEVVGNGGFTVTRGESFAFGDEEYNLRFGCSRPYSVVPEMRLKTGRGVLCLARELAPGERVSCTLAVDFSGKAAVPEPDFAAVVRKNRAFWDRQRGTCRIGFPDAQDAACFDALQWNSLQLLLELDSPSLGHICQPSQGGSSERFYVWVWEAMQCLRPMLQLGHFAPVKKVLDFIFKLQDGGTPPEGRFHSLAGAVGTTGPRWANATGAALLLAADYAVFSGDRAFLDEYLPKMFRAARWILGEVKATRRYRPDGSKGFGFGVMPLCCANDGDWGYVIASTDVWNFAGAEQFARLLKKLGAPEYDEIHAEVEQYRADLSAAIDSVCREDGFIDRKLSDEGKIARVFEKVAGAGYFLETGFASPDEPRFRKYIAFCEREYFDGPFISPMFDGIYYVGNGEQNMFYVYAQLHEWKKAYLAAETFRQCAMTPDLWLMQERYSSADAAFTPWQPNASNNGRYLQMTVRRLFLERGEQEIILFGGIAPSGMLAGKDCALRGLNTYHGKVDLNLRSGRMTLAREEAFPAGMRFAFPDFLSVASAQFDALGGNAFALKTASAEVTADLAVDPAELL